MLPKPFAAVISLTPRRAAPQENPKTLPGNDFQTPAAPVISLTAPPETQFGHPLTTAGSGGRCPERWRRMVSAGTIGPGRHHRRIRVVR